MWIWLPKFLLPILPENKPDKDAAMLAQVEMYFKFEETDSFAPTMAKSHSPSVLELPEWNVWPAPTQRRQRVGPVACAAAEERFKTPQCPLDAWNCEKRIMQSPAGDESPPPAVSA